MDFIWLFIYPLCVFILADEFEWRFPNLKTLFMSIKLIVGLYVFIILIHITIALFMNILKNSFSNH